MNKQEQKQPISAEGLMAILNRAIVQGGNLSDHLALLHDHYRVNITQRGSVSAIGPHPGYSPVDGQGQPERIELARAGENPRFFVAAIFVKHTDPTAAMLLQYAITE